MNIGGGVVGAIGKIIKGNDFVVTNKGKIIQAHPEDTIFATKNPENLGSSRNISITITGNIYGTDPDEIAEALVNKLKSKISI